MKIAEFSVNIFVCSFEDVGKADSVFRRNLLKTFDKAFDRPPEASV